MAALLNIFRQEKRTWTLEQTVLGPPTWSGDAFGWSVGLSNDVLIVGDHTDDGPGNDTGAAFVYQYVDGTWTYTQTLKPTDNLLDQQKWFGRDLALDAAGDTAVIGAPHDLSGSGFQFGSAFVFEYDGVHWNQSVKLTAAKPVSDFAAFGQRVAISEDGNTILVGAPTAGGSGPGSAHLFRRKGPHWIETWQLELPGSGCLGVRLAIHGDTALVAGGCNVPSTIYVLRGIQEIDCNNNGVNDGCDIAPGIGLSHDSNHNGIPDECDGLPDFDGDGVVGPADLGGLLSAWGQCPPPPPEGASGGGAADCVADVNHDGVVGPADLAQLLALWGQIIPGVECPNSDDSPCTTHAAPGCDDLGCCDAICAIDAFCCTTTWDTICVNEAQALCGCPGPPGCGHPEAGDCCAFGGLPGVGCSSASCCETICDYIDPFCCEVQWDASCANWAVELCAKCPPWSCTPNAGSCCQPLPPFGAGCNELECCTLVCEYDPFCCEFIWDGICGGEAQLWCPSCGGTPPR